jgi:hypothetical protein
MEPNFKILLDDLMKEVWDEIKLSHDESMASFTSHVNSIDKCFIEMSADEKKHDNRVTTVESAAAVLDVSLTEWKPQVEESFHSICLELSKLNSYFNRDAREASTVKPGVLTIESAPQCPPLGSAAADGLGGHHVKNWNRDCGFESVYTHTHDPVKGTMPSPLPNFTPHQFSSTSARDSTHPASTLGSNAKLVTGRLLKMNFLKFEDENPKLW